MWYSCCDWVPVVTVIDGQVEGAWPLPVGDVAAVPTGPLAKHLRDELKW